MSKICYFVKAEVLKSNKTCIESARRKVRIIPSTEDLPPPHIDLRDNEFCMRKEVILRKHALIGSRLGSLVAEVSQPASK